MIRTTCACASCGHFTQQPRLQRPLREAPAHERPEHCRSSLQLSTPETARPLGFPPPQTLHRPHPFPVRFFRQEEGPIFGRQPTHVKCNPIGTYGPWSPLSVLSVNHSNFPPGPKVDNRVRGTLLHTARQKMERMGCGGGISCLRSEYFNLMGVDRESEGGGGRREEAAKELFFSLAPPSQGRPIATGHFPTSLAQLP